MNLIKTNNLNPPITPKRNLSLINNIIESPYEKVLSILQETLNSLNLSSKIQSKLFTDLQWVLKIIKSRLLYSYEIKEKDYVAEMARTDPNFKQFVEFVREYNEQMIEMKKKNNYINNELLQKPSFKLKRQFNNQKIHLSNKKLNFYGRSRTKNKIVINCDNKENNRHSGNYLKTLNDKNENISDSYNNIKIKISNTYLSNNYNVLDSPIIINNRGILNIGLFNNYENNSINRLKSNGRYSQINSLNNLNLLGRMNSNLSHDSNNFSIKKKSKLLKINDTKMKHAKIIQKVSKSFMQNSKSDEKEIFEYDNLNKNSNIYIEHLLKMYNYDMNQITDKSFNIFELKKIVGQMNVLPIIGGVIIEKLGLKNDKIINVNKLEPFLNLVSSQYLPTTLYHNNMHGADVCQSVSLYFLNSNAEKILQTTLLDLLSIIIASLGHDLGHPGLNNNFHINARTELALTYNDSSCLENYHCSKLFNILKKDEVNIFEVLNNNDFKDIRKRMISEILATDMFYHKKIIDTAQSKIKQIKPDKFEFLSTDKESIKSEQQSILDFFIHTADLAHNSKLFKISLKWVELLSEEFWLQGDKEKSLGINVSYLCDRNKVNVPKDQVGFLNGVILPTFGILTQLFPGLNYTMENIMNNIKEWQKLADENRKKGWTPKKIKDDENGNKNNNKINNYKMIGANNENINNIMKTKSE